MCVMIMLPVTIHKGAMNVIVEVATLEMDFHVEV